MIDTQTRLRVGRSIEKTEEEVAQDLMRQVKRYAPDAGPPALVTDGKGAYREAMLETWGKVPEYGGREARQNFLSQEKTGIMPRLLRNEKEASWKAYASKLSMEIQKKLKRS